MIDRAAPVVLVHGLWHGSWCWSPVAEELAARGVASVAVDLEGHGLRAGSPGSRWLRPFDPAAYAAEPSPVAAVTASSAAADLVARIRRIGRGRACVLVAHSMGGVVATAAAEQAPELVSHLVYVAAFAPVAGRPAADYIAMPEMEDVIQSQLSADPGVVGALRYDLGDPAVREQIHRTFYNDLDPAGADAATSLITCDGPVGMAAEALTVTPARYGSIPHTYVVALRDRAIRPAIQRRFIDEIDAVSARSTTVVELDTSHSPFLSRPADLAEIIGSAGTDVAG